MNRVSKEDHGSKLGFTERETEGKNYISEKTQKKVRSYPKIYAKEKVLWGKMTVVAWHYISLNPSQETKQLG